MDVFDKIQKKDIFSRTLKKKLEGDIFERIDAKLPPIIRTYVKEEANKNQKNLVALIRKEVETIPAKVVEVQKPIPPTKDYADLAQIEELRKEIEELKKIIEDLKKVPVSRPQFVGSIGAGGRFPRMAGHTGEFLSTDGNMAYWTPQTAGGTSSEVYTTSNVTTHRDLNADSTSLNQLADVLASLIVDLQGAGILQ